MKLKAYIAKYIAKSDEPDLELAMRDFLVLLIDTLQRARHESPLALRMKLINLNKFWISACKASERIDESGDISGYNKNIFSASMLWLTANSEDAQKILEILGFEYEDNDIALAKAWLLDEWEADLGALGIVPAPTEAKYSVRKHEIPNEFKFDLKLNATLLGNTITLHPYPTPIWSLTITGDLTGILAILDKEDAVNLIQNGCGLIPFAGVKMPLILDFIDKADNEI